VFGYDKIPRAYVAGESVTGITDAVAVDPIEIFTKIYGRAPSEPELGAFIPKLKTILPFDFKPIEGRLFYCGIDVKDLVAAHSTTFGFEEVIYLLLTGELPDRRQLKEFTHALAERRALPFGYVAALTSQFKSRNMMNILQTAIDNLYENDPKPDSTDVTDVTRHAMDIIAKFPSLIAYAHQGMRHKYHGEEISYTQSSQGYSHAEDFLRMLRGGKPVTREEAKLLDTFLILHAEHGGGNNSTFTVRVVSSSETDTFSAISSGLASLKGHLHGGANEKVMAMMEDIKKEVKDWTSEKEVFEYLCKVLRKEVGDRSGKIYGMGHAVYTISDPRAIILRNEAEKLARTKGRMKELALLDLVASQGPKAFAHVKGSKKHISPNVDFYSGFVLDCLEIPMEIYTPLFAMARVTGWLAHRLEQLVQNRIIRPAYLELVRDRPYVPMEKR
jgi:citrate synthase